MLRCVQTFQRHVETYENMVTHGKHMLAKLFHTCVVPLLVGKNTEELASHWHSKKLKTHMGTIRESRAELGEFYGLLGSHVSG